MNGSRSRRRFLHGLASTAALAWLSPWRAVCAAEGGSGDRLFEISLAEWSLNKSIRAGKLANLDFPRAARRDFGIRAVEFVDQFFSDKARDKAYLA
ncbi:MAG: sugar phosphate isomerase/epimerase, partial [Planctomycetes bacterium]|nr:sugar phosphate isomerase/epimerase [Planctomycetota bacterium]